MSKLKAKTKSNKYNLPPVAPAKEDVYTQPYRASFVRGGKCSPK